MLPSFPKRHRHHPDNSGIRRKFKSARHFNFTVFASRLFADKHDAAVSPEELRTLFVGVWLIFLAKYKLFPDKGLPPQSLRAQRSNLIRSKSGDCHGPPSADLAMTRAALFCL